MPGESVLLIEDSPAELEIAESILTDAGYRVATAANAAAALTYPDMADVNIIVMDAMLDSVSGFETTRMLRQQVETHPIPILMLIPEDSVTDREDLSARGANGFMLKPYDARSLTKKVAQLLEAQHLDDLSRQYLDNAADGLMSELADKHIREAVDRKTQIIVERCIQSVATAVEQRAREEVEQHVTALTAEKEQELVKLTVREVAQSMVEKLAERKVTEAMESTLPEQSEKAIKKLVDQTLPTTIRERLKESCNNMLPREIQVRLQKAAEKMVPELSGQLVATVDAVANKSIPRVARELLPELTERQVKITLGEQVPRLVADLVGRELESQLHQRMEPAVRDSIRGLRRTILIWNAIMGGVVGFGALVVVYMLFFASN